MSEQIDSTHMTPEQLRQAGELLYGTQWQTDFARAIDVDARRVRQWLSGDRPIPKGLWTEVIELLNSNSKNTAAYAEKLQQVFDSIKNQA
ncbi:TPA: transcriptional regulator [Acinetobacter baumannii]|uniref:helix-turn-helix domain-containing protein n=1 Tax=Bacteria TaxID=2 RepID=UPI001EEF9AB9|nr:helix-turn-helix domain-containing protein [Acinetobacter baumannii]EJB8464318.1 transcriptional regulator [Acinetobacter baumannii]MCG6641613.1 transcriptional regulator [Acinetobacter baumannii]MCG6641683.1 transcriptional regulator [Acinetobacter baumannii]MDC4516482.1 helix-turn-helix domain-containing protein [Acinetobacter baumannii]MDC5529691.1 helix-turn-helix domain-containing protein [Acinetobacter baumannii]